MPRGVTLPDHQTTSFLLGMPASAGLLIQACACRLGLHDPQTRLAALISDLQAAPPPDAPNRQQAASNSFPAP